MSIQAWHFVTADRKLRDKTPMVIGSWLEHPGALILCQSGYHASVKALDAELESMLLGPADKEL